MKKLTALLLAVLLVFGLAACAGSPAEPNAKPGDTMTLQDILTSITKDVADLPDTETTALTKDNFEYFAFTAMPDGVEAIAADALINAVPHSVVLMRAQDAETAKKLAADVEANLNPAKWVCVEAEKTAVLVHNLHRAARHVLERRDRRPHRQLQRALELRWYSPARYFSMPFFRSRSRSTLSRRSVGGMPFC